MDEEGTVEWQVSSVWEEPDSTAMEWLQRAGARLIYEHKASGLEKNNKWNVVRNERHRVGARVNTLLAPSGCKRGIQ
jgi:hypothetical protein